METRRTFIQKVLVIFLSNIFLFGCKTSKRVHAKKSDEPKSVLVLWFSQTGYTERYGKLIAFVWKKMDLKVTASDIREFANKNLNEFDLILIGSPVNYYDIPEYVKNWISSIEQLKEISVASYVSYGGPEGDQYNTANTILELLSEKGGIPVGMETFMNLAVFPLYWNEETISSPSYFPVNKNLPNEETYKRVRSYAHFLIDQVKKGNQIEVDKNITLRRLSTIFNPVFWTKFSIQKHGIDKDKCIQCYTCANKCPADAIDPSIYKVNQERCVVCFGCINNCPQDAIIMTNKDKRLFGFRELLKRKNIKINEPEEFQVRSKS